MTGVLDGKTAVVTGTSRGVGGGIAHELLRAGATVVGCSRSELDAIPGTSDNPEWASRSAQLVCDQGDHQSIDAFINRGVDAHGRLDILVNNAGGTVPAVPGLGGGGLRQRHDDRSRRRHAARCPLRRRPQDDHRFVVVET